jgi:hypothetical protein
MAALFANRNEGGRARGGTIQEGCGRGKQRTAEQRVVEATLRRQERRSPCPAHHGCTDWGSVLVDAACSDCPVSFPDSPLCRF